MLCTRYHEQVALPFMWDRQAGALTNVYVNTNAQLSQVTVPTRH